MLNERIALLGSSATALAANYNNIGRAYENLGQPLEALKWYRRALEIDPLFLPAEQAKNLLLGKLN